MEPDKLARLLRDVRTKPGKTIAVLLFLIALFLVAAWVTGYLQEKGRRKAEREQTEWHEPRLRVQYYRFQGTQLLDLVTRGYGFSPQAGFDARPQWLKTDTFNQLRHFLSLNRNWPPRSKAQAQRLPFDILSVYLEHPDLDQPKAFEYHDYGDTTGAPREIAQLVGSMPNFRGYNLVHAFSPGELIQKLRRDPYWTLKLGPKVLGESPNIVDAWDVTFFAAPTKEELLSYRVPHSRTVPALRDPISLKLLDRYPHRRDLVFLNVDLSHDGYYGILRIRELQLLAVNVENVGDHAVEIESVDVKALPARDPFTLTDSAAAEKSTWQHRELAIPLELLLPGENLMIPLRLELGFPVEISADYFWNSEAAIVPGSIPDKRDLGRYRHPTINIEVLRGLYEDGSSRREVVSIPKDVLEAKFDFSGSITPKYLLGSVIDPVALSIKGPGDVIRKQAVRQFDPNNLVVSGAFEKGSCPIVYADYRGEWRRIGPVLREAVGRERTLIDAIQVPRARRFRLMEEEAEVAHIFSVALRVSGEEAGGSDFLLYPNEYPEWGFGEDAEVTLHRGEFLDLSFDMGSLPANVRTELQVKGFYIPDSLLIRSGQGPPTPPALLEELGAP